MSKTILLADDSLTIQKVVELTFMEENFEVVSVSDGDHALTKLAELTPNLVIADVHMPGASGYEVCSQVKSAQPGVPVLLLVGTFEVFDEDEAKAAGADAHLKKPFDSQELLQMVEGLVGSGGGQAPEPEAEPEPEEPVEAVETPMPPFPEAAEPEEEVAPVEEVMGLEVAPTPEESAEQVVEAEIEPIVPEEVPPFEGKIIHAPADLGPESVETEPAEEMEVISEEVAAAPEPLAPPPLEEPPVAPEPASAAEVIAADAPLSEEDVERIARKVVELLGEDIVREISWEVIPDLAEIVIKSRLRELEEQVD